MSPQAGWERRGGEAGGESSAWRSIFSQLPALPARGGELKTGFKGGRA